MRALLVALVLFASPVALAAGESTRTAASITSDGNAVVTTSGASTTSGGMRPGVAAPPKAKHPYFFAAYAAVWAGLFAYALWLGSRISSLEQKVTSVTDRSR